MKLATHNSLSYVTPQWWARGKYNPIRFISQCQSMTIDQQYEFGVRYFDIRVWFKNNKAISRHGLAMYDINLHDILSYLNGKDGVVVRLVLENWREKDSRYDNDFCSFCKVCVNAYKNIQFVGGIKKIPWTTLIDLGSVPCRDCFEKFGDDKWEIYSPKWNAEHNNRHYWQIAKYADDDKWNMFDFIEIK